MPEAGVFSAAFVLSYAYIAFASRYRGLVVWLAAAAAVTVLHASGRHPDIPGLLSAVDLNILLIFSGILMIAEVLLETGAPAWAAERLVAVSGTLGRASLLLCALSGAVSMILENVATVMILAPVALELSRRLEANPVPLLLGIAVSSNLQGTATLVGDPPSMILASAEGLSFNDFFVLDGRPGIFFAVQAGALASLVVLWLVMGRNRRAVTWTGATRVTSWVPAAILAAVIAGLALVSLSGTLGIESGLICAAGGVLALLWHACRYRGSLPGLLVAGRPLDGVVGRGSGRIVRSFDFDTLFLLAGVFLLAGALERYGVIASIGRTIAVLAGGGAFRAFALVVASSVLISAFVDNVPFVTVMLPAVRVISDSTGLADGRFLSFGLLIGACLGGNISPVGASANIVAVSVLRRAGYRVGFGRFVSIGLPFTLAATLAGAAVVWVFWGP